MAGRGGEEGVWEQLWDGGYVRNIGVQLVDPTRGERFLLFARCFTDFE